MAETPRTDEDRARESLIEAERWERRIIRLFNHYAAQHPNHPNRAAIAATEDLNFEGHGYGDIKGNLDLHRMKAQMYAQFAILERMQIANRQETRASTERQTLIDQNRRIIELLTQIRDNTSR